MAGCFDGGNFIINGHLIPGMTRLIRIQVTTQLSEYLGGGLLFLLFQPNNQLLFQDIQFFFIKSRTFEHLIQQLDHFGQIVMGGSDADRRPSGGT